MDFTEFQPSGSGEFGGGFILRGPGSQILGSGDVQSNYALLHQTATGASLDASQFHVTSAALHSGGGGSGWQTPGWLATCSDGSLVKTTGVTGGAVTGVTLVIGSYSSAAPTNPVTCASEQIVGVPDGAGNPIIPPTTLQVDMTATLANSGSPIFALGGSAIFTAATAAVDTNTTQLATTGFVLAQASGTLPLIDGTATIGTSTRLARADHIHPTDTTRAPVASPTFTGTVTIPAGASISGFAPLASPTFSGIATTAQLFVGTNATASPLDINGPAASNRLVAFLTANSKRWQLNANNTAEGGSNAGTDFVLSAFDDSGTLLFSPLTITRSTGLITAGSITVTGTLTSASYKSGAAVGVSCAANTVTLLTEVVTNGIVTHC
jgi:hypothetical protein